LTKQHNSGRQPSRSGQQEHHRIDCPSSVTLVHADEFVVLHGCIIAVRGKHNDSWNAMGTMRRFGELKLAMPVRELLQQRRWSVDPSSIYCAGYDGATVSAFCRFVTINARYIHHLSSQSRVNSYPLTGPSHSIPLPARILRAKKYGAAKGGRAHVANQESS
jgi:hypothetical protein